MRSSTMSPRSGWGPRGAATRWRTSGMALGRGQGQGRDVTIPVVAGPQEVRGDDHDDGGTGGHAGVESGGDGRLGQLHVGRLDDAVGAPPAPFLNEHLVSPVGLLATGSVVDDDDAEGAVADEALLAGSEGGAGLMPRG